MDVPESHTLGVDARSFLEGVRQQTQDKLRALKGIKFQLVLKIQLRKHRPDGVEEYTDPVLHHKQEALLQDREISEALNKSFSTIQELLENGHREDLDGC